MSKSDAYLTIRTLLRTCFAILLMFALTVPHFRMAQAQQSPTMVMSDISDDAGVMNHGKAVHERMSGLLCVVTCAGTSTFGRVAYQLRYDVIVPIRWRVETTLAWLQPTPDPALRPPDLLRHA